MNMRERKQKNHGKKPQLTGAQLNFLVSTFGNVANHIQQNIIEAKAATGHFWHYSEKGTPAGEAAFSELNYARSAVRKMRYDLDKINKLIVTFKAQRRGTL